MRIFVTGGTGFIGSHFLQQALQAGHEVVALRRPGSQPRIDLNQHPEWIEGDLQILTPDVLEGCEAFVHFAAAGVSQNESKNWELCFEVNLMKSLALWRLGRKAGIKKFLITGSCFEYGMSGGHYHNIPANAPLLPTDAYAASKAAATMAASSFSLQENADVTVLRPFHVYGEGESAERFWPSLKRAALAGEDFPMTAGEQVRDFCPVEQAARSFLDAVNYLPAETCNLQIENLGTGQPIRLRDFAERCWSQWQARGKILYGEIPYRDNEVMRYVPEIKAR